MTSIFTYIWQRRWCRILVSIALVVGLACLHPFVRQTLIGPKIDGIPWCTWENEVRVRADPQTPEESWLYRLLRKLDLAVPPSGPRLGLDNPAALPLYLHLADDRDVRVRRQCLARLEMWAKKHEAEIVPVMRKHLQDDDPLCRVLAARAIWSATKDPEMKSVFLAAIDDQDEMTRLYGRDGLFAMAPDTPGLFEVMAKMSESSMGALSTMPHFGKLAVPVLRRRMNVGEHYIRVTAIGVSSRMGKATAELVPDLLVLQDDADPDLRVAASRALHAIDPKRFPDPDIQGK